MSIIIHCPECSGTTTTWADLILHLKKHPEHKTKNKYNFYLKSTKVVKSNEHLVFYPTHDELEKYI